MVFIIDISKGIIEKILNQFWFVKKSMSAGYAGFFEIGGVKKVVCFVRKFHNGSFKALLTIVALLIDHMIV